MSAAARRPADLLVPAAMVYPTVGAWVYFVLLDGTGQARWVYLLSKGVQLALPLAWLALTPRERWGLRLGRSGAGAGLASGFAVAAGLWLLDAAWFAGSPLAVEATERIRSKLADFAIGSPAAYLGMAAALSVVHSLFEELYWRWFVYGRLAERLPAVPAMALASLAFASHHVLIAYRFAPPTSAWSATLLASAAIAGAGAHWCLLYRRRRALLAPWLSHLLVDGALMALGYRLLWG